MGPARERIRWPCHAPLVCAPEIVVGAALPASAPATPIAVHHARLGCGMIPSRERGREGQIPAATDGTSVARTVERMLRYRLLGAAVAAAFGRGDYRSRSGTLHHLGHAALHLLARHLL